MKKNRAPAYSEFILVYCFYIFLNVLPQKLSLKIGRLLGVLFYKIDKKHRKHTLNNLKIAFPDKSEKELNDISVKFYKNLGMVFVEIFRLDKYNESNIDYFVESNFDSVKNIYGKQGILLLTAHFGNWELLAKTFGLKDYKGNVLARPLDNSYIEKILYKLRTGSGNKVIYNRENAVKNIISALNANEIVGFLPDENASKRIGVFVDFFGVKACTMPGMANIAAKTKLPVIPAFIVRINEKDGSKNGDANYSKHRLIIEPPLDIKYTGDRKTDTMNILKMFNEKIEDIIKRYPEQWFWIHNRWKTRPDDE